MIAALKKVGGADVRENVALSQVSAWRIGGVVDFLIVAKDVDAFLSVVAILRDEYVPWMTIGGTTNLLFLDGRLPGALVCLGSGFKDLAPLGNGHFIAGAGLWVPRFARGIARHGWAGVEHTIGIPGTLGGLIAMNGGSQRRCIGEHIVEVAAVTRNGEIVRLSARECDFSRRHSFFQQEQATVVSATFALPDARAYADSRREMREIMASRRAKFPMDRPNCGSVFVSDPTTFDRYGPPGRLIEDCGLKGLAVGGAQISTRHANFIVNNGDASARDVLALIRACIVAVREKFGVSMATEVKVVDRACRLASAAELALELDNGG